MHRTLPGILLLFLAAAADAQTRAVEEAASEADLAKLYAGRCASCHVPPDPSFAVDRAWITQLADTA